MARLISKSELEQMEIPDIIDGINTGAQIVGATLPLLSDLINKIIDWSKGIHVDSLSLPKGKRKAIEALQALEKIDQQKQELYDKYFAQLIEKGIITE